MNAFFSTGAVFAAIGASAIVAAFLWPRARGALSTRVLLSEGLYLLLAPWPVVGLFGLRTGVAKPWMPLTWAAISVSGWLIGHLLSRRYSEAPIHLVYARRLMFFPGLVYCALMLLWSPLLLFGR